MDSDQVDLVNLHGEQVRPPERIGLSLPQEQENQGMLKPDVVDRIREWAADGIGVKEIARRLELARNTVRRYLAGARVGFQERPAARRLDLDTQHEVECLFAGVAEGNAVVIQQELAARGVEIELRTLQRAVAPLRQEARARALATVRFETKPGQQMQIDFGQKTVMIAGNPVTVHLMTVVLGYSRRLFCQAFLSERQDDWLEGIDAACRHFGGLPEQILCDNASPLVLSHDSKTGVVVWHPGFAAFCKDRGITPRACRPRRARTKGKIERGVGYVKHNALAGRTFATFEALRAHLAKWIVAVADKRIHGTTKEQPILRFERDERQALRPLPSRSLAIRTRRLPRRVSADCFVDIDTIRYSVPHRHVRETVEVVVGLERVEVWLRGQRIASHTRSFEPGTWVRDPAHFEGLYRPMALPVTPAQPHPVARPLSAYSAIVEGVQP